MDTTSQPKQPICLNCGKPLQEHNVEMRRWECQCGYSYSDIVVANDPARFGLEPKDPRDRNSQPDPREHGPI